MWEFACLPFGLASAPKVFTKLLKPVVSILRQMGLRIIIYLDDILIMPQSCSLTLTHASTALNLLEGLGFEVNYEKSCLEPSQVIEFIGFEINSQSHNKLGGTHSFVLNSLAHDLWTWCLASHVHLTAQHIPGVTNTLADWESTVFQDSSDWKLNPQVFAALNQIWGPLEIDLFTSRLTRQLPIFVSWKPDPEALGTDAFTLDWSRRKEYAFPPFSLKDRCLRKVQVEQVTELVIVTPVWPAQEQEQVEKLMCGTPLRSHFTTSPSSSKFFVLSISRGACLPQS